MQFLLQHRFGRQFGQVFGDVDASLVQFQQFDLFLFFAATQNNAQRRGFARFLLVFG